MEVMDVKAQYLAMGYVVMVSTRRKKVSSEINVVCGTTMLA